MSQTTTNAVRASLVAALLLAGTAAAQGGGSTSPCGGFRPGFGTLGFESPVYDSVVHDDGNGTALFLAGETFRAAGIEVQGVARWDGTTLQQLGTGITGLIGDLLVFDDGSGTKLAAGGAFPQGNQWHAAVAIWDGQSWTMLPFIPHTSGEQHSGVGSLALFDAGSGPRLIAGGDFGLYSVMQWDGATWTRVGGDLSAYDLLPDAFVTVLRVFDLGNGPALYAGGRFQRTDAPMTNLSRNVAVWTGGLWQSLGTGAGAGYDDQVNTLEVFDDGSGPKLVAGGRMQPLPTGAPFRLAQWDGTTWTPFLEDAGGTWDQVTYLRAFGAGSGVTPGLWVGGSFTHVGSLAAQNIARWDGSTWSNLGSGNTLFVPRTIVPWDDQSGHGARVIAGATNGALEWFENGAWTPATGGGGADSEVTNLAVLDLPGQQPQLFAAGLFNTIGGVGAHRFARYDGTQWVGGDPSTTVSVMRMRVLDTGNGPHLYASGSFVGRGGAVSNVARLEGSTWTLLPLVPTWGGHPPTDFAVFDDGSGIRLFVSGFYGLWRLDGNAWTSVIGQPNPGITDLLAFDDGSGPSLFLAGTFTTIGGLPYRCIARWNGTTLDDLDGGTPNSVHSMCGYDDGTGPALYASGNFVSIGGVTAGSIARWDGQAWSPVGGGFTWPAGAFDMIVHDEGSGFGPELVATGVIPTAGGTPVSHIARWNGTSWRNMDGGLRGATPNSYAAGNVLAVYDARDGHGPELFVGGRFSRAGTTVSANIARWRSCGGDATTFCFGDGSGAACPCGNASAVGSDSGCLNSFGIGGKVRVHGRASLSADTLVLEGSGMTTSAVLYYQGASMINAGLGAAFGDGIRCTGGPSVRLGTRQNSNGMSSYPGPLDPTLSVRGMITAPGTRHYQARYRNAAAYCTPDTFNYTSGVSVAWSH